MTDCTQELFHFPSFDRRKIEASFSGGDVSSDGGMILLRQIDDRLGLTAALDQGLADPRNPILITHEQVDLLRQRIYGLAMGYEDLNDHNGLRKDLLWQTALGTDENLASSPTLCRLENRIKRSSIVHFHRVLLDQFIASFKEVPSELVLDFDATDDRVHGNQAGAAYHGYYGDWCFLPLYVFCGEQLLVSYLRPSNQDVATHSRAILSLLVKRLRQAWPGVKIIMRGDSGFCRWKTLRWCDRVGVHYLVGLAQNSSVRALAHESIQAAEAEFTRSGTKVRLFSEVQYAAGTWERKRRVIVKAEHAEKGRNPRFLVTNLSDDPQRLYDEVYCARSEMENRIKEQQLGLFADRTSCTGWWPNQFRLMLSSCAYVLLEAVRRLGLADTELAHAQASTIRIKLLKIGTIILRNTRRIRLLLSNGYPYQALFSQVYRRLSSA